MVSAVALSIVPLCLRCAITSLSNCDPLFTWLAVSVTLCPSVALSTCTTGRRCLSFIRLSFDLSAHLLPYASSRPFLCLFCSLCLSSCLAICLPYCLPVCTSVCVSMRLPAPVPLVLCLSFRFRSVFLFVYLSSTLSSSLSTCSSAFPSVRRSVTPWPCNCLRSSVRRAIRLRLFFCPLPRSSIRSSVLQLVPIYLLGVLVLPPIGRSSLSALSSCKNPSPGESSYPRTSRPIPMATKEEGSR